MSYQVHNFQTGEIIEAAPINEMDAQIQTNEQQIGLKMNSSMKGVANGVASLDENGDVPIAQLPSMSGASASEAGTSGLVPVPSAGDNGKFLRGDCQWEAIVNDEAGWGSTGQTWSAGKIENELDAKAPSVINSLSGLLATFKDGKEDTVVEKIIIDIPPIQEGSGDPSTSNVRNISGRTSVQIGVAGKNLISGLPFANAFVRAMPSAVIDTDNKRVNFASNATVNMPIVGHSATMDLINCFQFKDNTQYTFILTYDKNSGATTSPNLRVGYTDGTYADLPTIETATTKGTVVYVSTVGKTITTLYKRNSSGTTHLYYEESGVFEGVLTAEEFEEWKGTVYGINFPVEAGTVYGGRLTINNDGTGKLSADKFIKEITSVDASQSSTGYQCSPIGTLGSVINGSVFGMCNMLKSIAGSASTMGYGECLIYNSDGYNRAQVALRISSDLNGSSATETRTNYNTYLQNLKDTGKPLVICYQLTTPVEYDLTVSQVKTLLGLNNIYCDVGEIYVKYTADTKMYVDESKDTVEGMIADADVDIATEDHAINEAFICDDHLYRAIAPIAIGDTIAVGTNVESITLARYIALLEEKAVAMALSPLNQAIFPNYNKNLIVYTGNNLRYADILYNTIKSIGNANRTGTTYRSVVLTAQGGPIAKGRLDQESNQLYKSYFQPIVQPVVSGYTYKLCVLVSVYENRNGSSNNSNAYVFTYDSEGVVKRCYFSTSSAELYFDKYYVLPDDFLTNGNIAVAQMYKNAKATIIRKFEFFLLDATQVPDYYTVLEPTTLTTPVVDDITPVESNTLMSSESE